MEVIANNIANMNTTGFKRESPVFESYMMNIEKPDGDMPRKLGVSFVRDALSTHDMSNGALTTTGNPLDVALDGPGFLAVSTPDGTRYTRNGSFGRDDQGRLVTGAGYPVLDDGGSEITFAAEETQITIARDGTISTDQGLRGKLGVSTFANEQDMKLEGDGLWSTDQAATPAADPHVMQGMLEQSNVQPVVEMVRMIDNMRAYQASTELLNANDDLSRRAVQKLGEVRA